MQFDKIDAILGYARLRWDRTSAISGQLVDARKFGLVPVEANKKEVHTVCRNSTVSFLKKSSPRTASHYAIYENTQRWEDELKNVNRFFYTLQKNVFVGDRYKANGVEEGTEPDRKCWIFEKLEYKKNDFIFNFALGRLNGRKLMFSWMISNNAYILRVSDAQY